MLEATTRASRRRLSLLVGLSTTATIAIACADATGSSRSAAVSLSLAARVDRSGTASLSSPVISGNGHVLDLQHGDLTLGDVRLDREDGRSHGDSDSDGRHDDDAVFHNGPVTIALPLDGGVVSPFTRDVPFGTYDELEADLEFLRLRGTYDGEPFDVTIEIDRELALELDPPLVVDANHSGRNVTIDADIAHCFRDPAGTPIDPRRLAHDPDLRASVRDCIARAMHAFEDHDRDADDEDSDSDRDSDSDSDDDTDTDGIEN